MLNQTVHTMPLPELPAKCTGATACAVQAKRKQMHNRSQSFVSTNQLLPLKHSFQLDERQGVFSLSLEATVPIFCVAVVATVDAEFLEAQGSVAILTVTAPPPCSAARCLATYRCGLPPLRRIFVILYTAAGVRAQSVLWSARA